MQELRRDPAAPEEVWLMLAFLTNALFFAYFSLFGSFTNIIAKPISDDGALWGVVLMLCVVAVAL